MNDFLLRLLRDPRLQGDLNPVNAALKRPAFPGAPVAGMDPRSLDPTGRPINPPQSPPSGAWFDQAPPTQRTHLGLAQRWGPLNVPFLPEQEQYLSPGRILLRSLVAGYNGRAGVVPRGTHGGVDPNADLKRALLQAQIGNLGADNTRADAMDKWRREHGDQSLENLTRHQGVTEGQGDQRIGQGDRRLDQGDRSLEIRIRGQDMTDARSGQRIALSQQREARQARVASAMMKWPEYMKNDYITSRQEAFKKYGADKDLLEAELDRVAADFEQRDKGLASPNPFENRDQYGNPKNDVVRGGSTTAAPKVAPKKKGFLESIFAPKEESRPDPLGIR